jgi:hypothetical protein
VTEAQPQRRFQFSLLTLLLAVAWSAVVMWMNVMPRVTVAERPHASLPRTVCYLDVYLAQWGVPFQYAEEFALVSPDQLPRYPRHDLINFWALAGDLASGLLLVVALTWGSNQLRRLRLSRVRSSNAPWPDKAPRSRDGHRPYPSVRSCHAAVLRAAPHRKA